MSASVYDSVLFKDSFGTEKMREIFSAESLVQKWLDVEAALAKAEGKLGIIPEAAAKEIISKAKLENIDIVALGKEMKEISHPIVPLIRQLTEACNDGHGEFVHWGATTQDIMDTANVLQIREAIEVYEKDILDIQNILIDMIENTKDVVLAGRTHGQHGLPITFAYKASVWLSEINRSSERLQQLKPRILVGQFSGAVGSLASIKENGIELQHELMKELDLAVPNVSWHAARDNFAEFASFMGILGSTLAKIANEVFHLQKTEFTELEEPFKKGKVGSSTMPHKRNPSRAQNIVTMSRILKQNVPLFLEAMVHQHERDMISWQMEWELLPESCLLFGAIASSSKELLAGLTINKERMHKNVSELTNGLIMSEAIMIKLGETIGRQHSHDLVYDACMVAYEENIDVREILYKDKDISSLFTEEEFHEMFEIKNYTGYSNVFADQVLKDTKAFLA